MKVILENKITSVSATSEHANWDADNVLNESPKKVWKSNGVDTATLTCSTSGEIDTIAIFNTNAESVSVSIQDPNEFDWANLTWENLTWVDVTVDVTVELSAQANNNALWGTFNAQDAPLYVAIDFAAATGETLQAGVVVVGKSTTLTDPQYGMQQGLLDYSISAELSNGAEYYKQRDIVRTFAPTALVQRSTEFYTIMNSIARDYGKTPMAWKVTDQSSFQWVVYAKLSGMPTGAHNYPTYSTINFGLTEVL